MAFHAARGTAGYQVRIERWHEKGRDVELDSREGLAAGDLFAAALVMPGRYRVLLGRKTVTEIKVRDPNPEKPHRTDQPVLVRSGQPRALRACRAAGREGQGGLIARALPGKE